MYRRILLSVLVCFSVCHVVAQKNLKATPNSISSSATSSGTFYYANRNEPPRAVEFNERTVATAYFLTNINRYFGIPADFTFVETESNTDNLGMRHRLLQQYYKDIMLEGMGYRVHERGDFITSANGKAVREVNLDTDVVISEEQAFHLAVKYLQTKDTTRKHGRKLIVSKNFTFTPESFAIAFQFDIDVSLIEQWRISIDARTGEIINKVSLVNTCGTEPEPPLPYGTTTGLTNYYKNRTIRVEKFDGGSSRLRGRTESGGNIATFDFQNVSVLSLVLFYEYHKAYDFYSYDDTYNTAYLKPAVSVQWAAEQAYEYYFKKHNRNSFDNNGGVIRSYVHVDQGMNNAFWLGNRKLLAFGDGSNNNPLVELDVVGHELTHGVTQYEAGLQYYYESGALNESFSDIFGKAVEFYTFGDTATWQLGRHFRDGGLRDMSNPNVKNQPDTYAGYLWYTGSEDNGGVHYNSGVQNFWYYLLCEGGTGTNDHQVNYSVNAIGMEAATNIAYRNLTEYLGSTSDYLDSRIGSMLATADLYGKNSAVYQEVDKAWDAVGVIDEPIITSLEVYDITATTVKIKGKMMPRADTANYHFEYGTTPAFGSSTSIKQYTNVVEDTLTGLQSETKYYLRLVATNKNGSTYFTSEFTTISLAPMVKIEQTVDVTENTATLHGQVNPNSLSTSFYFEYGPTPSLGMVTPTYLLSDTTEFLDVSASITGLQSRQTYYFRLVATNASASSATATETLFTASKPIITSYSPVTAPVGAEITIAGQNFNAILSKNLVSFGATRATVLSASSTELKVNVPAGASLGPISLLDAESGLSAESVQEFVPTFTDEFKKGDIQLRVGIADLFIYQTLVQDMDGDNKPDIVARHYPGFSVFLNVNQGGDITAESFVRSTFPVESAGYLYSADLDGNGLKDIVTQYQNGTRIYPNFSVPGFIFFGVPIDVPTGYLGEMKIIDFDQDGHSDLAGLSGNKLMIFRNQNPKGTISATNFELRYTSTLAHYVNFLSAADVNNDGKPDLVVGTYGENSFPILKNNSHPGVFEFEELIFQDNVRGRYARYGAYDLNQDSWKDVISQSPYETGNLAIIENLGASPEITLAMPVMAFSGNEHTAVQPADINGDSKVDLLIGTGNRTMIFLENKAGAGQPLSSSTFQKSDEFGMRVPESHSGDVTARLNINDLNGDGRPEVIAAYSYSYGPHDGYNMEIWQNAPADCPDPSLITLNVSSYLVTIVLPPNKTLDQYQIEYANSGSNYWYPVSSTILYLYSSTSYKLRIRAKCYLGFTEYHYINFQTDCVDTSNFSISNIGSSSATLQAYNLSSIEIQYSLAGKNQWTEVSQYASQISNLLPGTTYDVRFRGRCYMPSEFRYKQFTTLCPKLSSLNIFQLFYNKAVVTWTSNHPGNATLEYSSDNLTWASIDDTGTMAPLVPSKKYFVRGRLACTNSNSDFIYTSFTTPCPKVSSIYIDAVTPFSARVNWVDESGSNNYTLTYAVTAGEKLTTIQTSSTSFNLTGLSPGTQYIVKVAPECSGNKDYTEKIFSTVCYVPFDLSVNAITHTTAELSWSDNFSGVPYVVDYSILGSDVWKTATTTSTKISMIKLRPGTEYEARVHITCMSETAPYVSIRFETSLYGETTLAPNPTAGNVTLYPSKNLIGNRFIIHDNTGRIVASGELLDYNFNLSDLSPGIYTLRIDGNEPLKILKN